MAESILERVRRGTADANIRFDDLRHLLSSLGFSERVKGSHHIFTAHGSMAKPYQVKQVRRIITRYMLVEE